MPRPRRPFSGMEDIIEHESQWMQDESVLPLGTRKYRRWEASTHWAYSTPNGCYDPLTYLFVLDALMNIDPDIELRAGKLAPYLSTKGYRMTFDPTTVGKVVSDLCDAFEDVLGAKNGLLERSRDWHSTFYRIHRNRDTARVAQGIRDDLYRLAEVELTSVKEGIKPSRIASPLLECPAARGEWQEWKDE